MRPVRAIAASAIVVVALLAHSVARADDDARHAQRRRVRIISGIVTLAAGLGTLIGGAASLGIARATSNALSHPTPTDHYDPDWWAYGRAVDTLGIALTTVGGTGTLAGVVVIATGVRF